MPSSKTRVHAHPLGSSFAKSSSRSAPKEGQSNRHTFVVDNENTAFCVDRRYQFEKVLGKGAYGVVISAYDTLTDSMVAIKKVAKAFDDLIDAKRIVREVKFLRLLSDKNIISLKALDMPEESDCEDLYIITELMEADLSLILKSNQVLSLDHVQYFVYQTLLGLCHMHEAGVIHRDIKPSNLLVNNDCTLKICDFGLSKLHVEENSYYPADLTEYVVTRWYRAPEVMLASKKYGPKVDVWALGCVFAELLLGEPLFPGKDYVQQLQLIFELLGRPEDHSLDFITSSKALSFVKSFDTERRSSFGALFPTLDATGLDLISKMLSTDPRKRLSAFECINHPFFDDIRESDSLSLGFRHKSLKSKHVMEGQFFIDTVAEEYLTKVDIQNEFCKEIESSLYL